MHGWDWPPDVPSTPPPWAEQEWCDGGATCWHDDCLQWLAGRLEDLAYDAAREAAR